jgi:hypothetical protein
LIASFLWWALKNTRVGPDRAHHRRQRSGRACARAIDVNRVRLFWPPWPAAFFAGVGGSFLSLYYPGSWTEGLSSGQGLMAVALVIFARWNPLYCIRRGTALRCGRRARSRACSRSAFQRGYYFFNAAPYIMTLLIMIASVSPKQLPEGRARRTLHHQVKTRTRTMSGLGGFNKSPNGVVLGMVQLQLPNVVTPEDLAAQTQRSSTWSARRAATCRPWIWWSFPNTRCTAFRWIPTRRSCVEWMGRKSPPSSQACIDNDIWGCFSIMELQPGRLCPTIPA